MAFGGYVVFTASSLTARDIGVQDFDKRLENAQAELTKLNQENTSVGGTAEKERIACGKAHAEFFRRWQSQPAVPPIHQISFRNDPPPTGKEIASQISLLLQKPELSSLMNTLRLTFDGCDPSSVDLRLTKSAFDEATAALEAQNILFDPTALLAAEKRSQEISEKLNFLQSVRNSIYEAKVQAVALGGTNRPPAADADNNNLLLRLLQTSITRFGVLAVIGFLVSILVSLYRYNIRLSAFYMARADLLRLSGEHTSVSDFALLATGLTPHLEFGKSPPPPLAQLSDLIKSVKDVK